MAGPSRRPSNDISTRIEVLRTDMQIVDLAFRGLFDAGSEGIELHLGPVDGCTEACLREPIRLVTPLTRLIELTCSFWTNDGLKCSQLLESMPSLRMLKVRERETVSCIFQLLGANPGRWPELRTIEAPRHEQVLNRLRELITTRQPHPGGKEDDGHRDGLKSEPISPSPQSGCERGRSLS